MFFSDTIDTTDGLPLLATSINALLKKPSIILLIDFGSEIGLKKSSAQITANYNLYTYPKTGIGLQSF